MNVCEHIHKLYVMYFCTFYCQMKSSSLIGKPENLYAIFFIDNQNCIFPQKYF